MKASELANQLREAAHRYGDCEVIALTGRDHANPELVEVIHGRVAGALYLLLNGRPFIAIKAEGENPCAA